MVVTEIGVGIRGCVLRLHLVVTATCATHSLTLPRHIGTRPSALTWRRFGKHSSLASVAHTWDLFRCLFFTCEALWWCSGLLNLQRTHKRPFGSMHGSLRNGTATVAELCRGFLARQTTCPCSDPVNILYLFGGVVRTQNCSWLQKLCSTSEQAMRATAKLFLVSVVGASLALCPSSCWITVSTFSKSSSPCKIFMSTW